MGFLVEGVRQDQWYDTKATEGRFVRSRSTFRNWVTADGGAGPNGGGAFKAEAGRYHLYVSLACPWASRAVIFRKLKKLDPVVGMSIVSYHMGHEGWTFDTREGSTGDTANAAQKLFEIYLKADPHFTGRVSVPVLWDRTRRTIVNNESADIIRMFNSAFDAVTPVKTDYYPRALRDEIDAVNARVYEDINNGVYRAGFATTQHAYEEAFRALFDALEDVERRLSQRRYLVGGQITEADWRLFTTLIRFDAVYYGHFKCNLKRIVDYPNLWDYLRDLYQMPGIAETVALDHIKRHYYGSHPQINPTGIVPLGPALDFSFPHGRGRLT
jgi:putative glutathione S-transferase